MPVFLHSHENDISNQFRFTKKIDSYYNFKSEVKHCRISREDIERALEK